MLLKSIRFQIILWDMLILSVTLLVLALVLYSNFSRKLAHDTDGILRSRAQGIADSIDAYWEAERLTAGKNFSRQLFRKQNDANFARIAQRWVDEKNADPKLINLAVTIFDGRGNSVASSKNISIRRLDPEDLRSLRQGKSHFDDVPVEPSAGKTAVWRAFTAPVMENNNTAYIVQVLSPLTNIRIALHNLSVLLWVLFPLTALITGIAGAFLAKMALDPVHKMIATIHQITAENLKLRIDVPSTKDEIQALALTFNKMVQRLDEAFSSQNRFMQDIAHELKTPLSVLKGELEVTLKRARSAAEYEGTLASSLEEVNRLARIVEDLLTSARFETKTVALTPEHFDMAQLARSVVEDIRVLAQQKHIQINCQAAGGLTINADKNQIRRLLLNLLDNAVKYTPPQGQITLNAWPENNNIVIAVHDTGIGIPGADIPHIFERFYRADKSRSGTGFGLGLSIARSIAHAHQGEITVQSALQQGSSFHVVLPAHPALTFR